MKKFTFTMIMLSFAMILFAQTDRLRIPQSLQSLRADAPVHIKNIAEPLKPQDYIPSAKSVTEDLIGTTVYDLQTNSSCENRLYYYPSDNTMGGTWTRGINSPSFSERGTGYNYNDGTGWGSAPSSRIENERCGWPSYAPLGATGEIVVSHTEVSGLKVCTRATKGTGTWTQTVLAGPPGAVDISWPRVITTGPNHMYVHIIALTYQVYQGQNLALLYFRSLDGGQTWDKTNVILPGMGASDYLGFGGDDYAWAEPQGDTLCFAVAGQWVDGFFMRSYDNGDTWTKTVFFTNSNSLTPTSTPVSPFACLDGSVAIQLDHSGKAHVVVGRMFASSDGSQRSYYPGTDGLIYWNENMPPLADSLYLDTLDAHGQLLGYVVGNQAGDSIIGFPYYGVGLSSFPQITIDENDYIYVIWSGLTVGNPSPDNLNYRHLWGRGSLNGGQTWADMYDFNQGLDYIYKEFVFPSMTKFTPVNDVEVLYQTADQPGSAVKATTIPVPYHDNTIEVRTIQKSLFLPTGISEPGGDAKNTVLSCFPNPARDLVNVNLSLVHAAKVTVAVANLAGQIVLRSDAGELPKGQNQFTIRLNGLRAGVYFLSVNMNGETNTSKLIVE
jgi:hypothetical protein